MSDIFKTQSVKMIEEHDTELDRLRSELAAKAAVISRLDERCALYEQDLWKTRDELAEAAKVVRKCHDERNAAVAELATKDARIAALEAQLKRRDPDVTRVENRTDNSSGWANACEQDEGA